MTRYGFKALKYDLRRKTRWTEQTAQKINTLKISNSRSRNTAATTREANRGLQSAIKNTPKVQGEREKALNSVPGTGNIAEVTASRVNALKYIITNSNSPSTQTLTMEMLGFCGNELRYYYDMLRIIGT